jgi:DNA-binding NtrC family response regulator
LAKKTLSQVKVLLVDDDPNMQTMVRLFLSKEHIDVEFAGNGRIALHKLENADYDIIISDIQMPEMDGILLINEIKARRIDRPVITISAYGLDNLASKAVEAGAFEVLQKPVGGKLLLSAIEKALKAYNIISV